MCLDANGQQSVCMKTDRCQWGDISQINLSGHGLPRENKECPEHLPLLSLLHIPYKDRCDWLPTLCLINTVLPSSPSFLHPLSVSQCPGSLAFQAFIGDGCDRDAANTQWTSIDSIGNEREDKNSALI